MPPGEGRMVLQGTGALNYGIRLLSPGLYVFQFCPMICRSKTFTRPSPVRSHSGS